MTEKDFKTELFALRLALVQSGPNMEKREELNNKITKLRNEYIRSITFNKEETEEKRKII